MAIEKKEFKYENPKEKPEKEKKKDLKRNLEFFYEKKKLLEKIDKDKKLTYLKSLVERGLINLDTAEHIVHGDILNNEEIKEIFSKIDEIDEIQDIDDILPKHLRITKQEYMKAIDDPIFRKEIVKKLDNTLTYLYKTSNPFSS